MNSREEENKKIANIKVTMQRIYDFLENFSLSEKPIGSEYSNLTANLKNFEDEMINEVKSHKKGDWRDPVNTVNKLEDTIHQVFNYINTSKQRIKAIDDFQTHARNAKFTTKAKIEIAGIVVHLGIIAAVIPILLAPPIGIVIACSVISVAASITVIAIMAQTLFTHRKQDPNRGFAVCNSLKAFNEKRMRTYGGFFNPAKEVHQTNAFESNVSPAFRLT